MFSAVKRQLLARRMKQLISLAARQIYTEHFELDDAVNRLGGGKGGVDLVRAYISIVFATRLTDTLGDADINSAVEQAVAAERFLETSTFDSILDTYKELAEMNWLRRQFKILQGKLANKNDEHSYEGTIYAMERNKQGPTSEADRSKAKEMTSQISSLNRQIEIEQLKQLKQSDTEGYQRMMEDIETRSLQSDIDSTEALENEVETEALIQSLYVRLNQFLT